MNNRGFVKTTLIIVLFFLVVGLYYYTEPTKEVLGMITAKTDVNESNLLEVAEEVDSMRRESTDEEVVAAESEEEAEVIEETMVDASQSAHLLVSGSGEPDRDILNNIDSESNDTEED
jgi:hypothetical protein